MKKIKEKIMVIFYFLLSSAKKAIAIPVSVFSFGSAGGHHLSEGKKKKRKMAILFYFAVLAASIMTGLSFGYVYKMIPVASFYDTAAMQREALRRQVPPIDVWEEGGEEGERREGGQREDIVIDFSEPWAEYVAYSEMKEKDRMEMESLTHEINRLIKDGNFLVEEIKRAIALRRYEAARVKKMELEIIKEQIKNKRARLEALSGKK